MTASDGRVRASVQANYDRLSRWYDLLTGPFEGRYRRAGLRALGVQPGEAALEIGFGTGHGLLALAEAAGEGGRVCGVDLSSGMCRAARRRLGRARLDGSAMLTRADALRLPFAGSSFDAILMSFTLELFEDAEIPLVLQECRRVLRPGGRLGVVAMARAARPGLMSRLYLWLHERLPSYVDCRPIDAGLSLAEAGLSVRVTAALTMGGLRVSVVVACKEVPT